MTLTIILFSSLLGVHSYVDNMDYLKRVMHCTALCREDIAAMETPANHAAQLLFKGGKLWAAGQPSLISEISGRAGGFMAIHPLGSATPTKDDVVLYTSELNKPIPESLKKSGAFIVVFGDMNEFPVTVSFSNHAVEANISPTLANAIPAWLFTGELIGALTRLGKMPVIFESIGAYSGNARIVQYKSGAIMFHDDKTVPAVPAGKIGNTFADRITAMLKRVKAEEYKKIVLTARWVREAKAADKRLFMYSMGHLFPDEVSGTDMGKLFHSDVWNAGFPHSIKPNDVFQSGDMIILIGYQQPPDDLLRKARPAGARVSYLALRADRDYVKDSGVIWIDPMWDWPDACVPLEGYDVPLLAASGVINGAIAWEIYRLSSR